MKAPSLSGLALFCALCCLLSAAKVRAEAEAWAVVPVVVGTGDDAQLSASRAAQPFTQALSETARVLPRAAARERFETRASSPPISATHTDLDQIARDAQLALYHVAMGLYTNASADVERVMSRADRALESLNRETLAARQLLDSCLFIVRARLQERKPKAARAQAFECRRLVPDMEPEASMHPPDVIGELAAAEAALEMQKPGSLRVTSEPTGCPVFIQGRNLGQTPLELPRLSRGEYRIQVECVPGHYGRVHRVTLGPSRTLVHVDSHFDAAVHSSDGVSLRYGTDAARTRHARAHAIEVGRAVGARNVALLQPEPGDGNRVRVSALEVEQGRLRASVIVQLDDTGALMRVDKAIATLQEGRSLDLTAEPPVPLPETETVVLATKAEPQAAPSALRAVAKPLLIDTDADADDTAAPDALAWALGGTGVATHLAGWALYAHLMALEADYRKVRDLPDSAEARRRLARIDAFELAPPITALSGAALTTLALPLLLPEARPGAAPLWALITGSAGLAVAGTGAVLLVSGGGCDAFDRLGRCDDVPATTRLGAMLLGTAVPLLSIPIVYLLRGAGVDEHGDVALEASPEGFALQWRGTL